jgi:hypothetical protein
MDTPQTTKREEPQTIEEFWKQDAEDHNRACKIARERGLQFGDAEETDEKGKLE